MYFFKVLIFLTFLFLASSCTSTYYQIKTLETNFDIENNKEIIYVSDSLYDISVNFHTLENNHLDFFIYISNKSETVVEINPSEISIEYLHKEELFDSSIYTNKSFALNPENEIEIIDGKIIKVNKDKKLLSCLNCLGATFSLVGIFTSPSNTSSTEKVAESIGTAIEYIGNQSFIEKSTEANIENLKERKYFWENSVLKKIYLEKDEDIGGRILVKFNEKYPFFRLFVPLDKKEYIFKYQVIKIRK